MNENYSILIDPSGTGDTSVNQEIRDKSCEICGYPGARGGSYCARCNARAALQQQQRLRSFNMAMHGCEDPIHIHGVGWLNPHDRSSRRFLDD